MLNPTRSLILVTSSHLLLQVTNPSRVSIDAQTEKVKAALVRGDSFDSGKAFSPGEWRWRTVLGQLLPVILPFNLTIALSLS